MCRADQTLETLVTNTEKQTTQSAMDEEAARDLMDTETEGKSFTTNLTCCE